MQGLVLFGAPFVRHHTDQWLHGTAQIVSHVKQTANAGTWGEKEGRFHLNPACTRILAYLHDMKNVIFVLWFSFFCALFTYLWNNEGSKALLRPAAYQSYSQYHNVNTKLCIIQQRRDRSRVVWLNGSWQKYVSASFPGMTLFNQFFTSKFCTQIS